MNATPGPGGLLRAFASSAAHAGAFGSHGAGPDQAPQLKTQVEAELRIRGLRTVVQILPPGSLDRTQFKAKRIIDRRDLYDTIVHQA